MDPTTFVHQMASGGRLAQIYVSNGDGDGLSLFLAHFGLDFTVVS